jgi:hypothetical protein
LSSSSGGSYSGGSYSSGYSSSSGSSSGSYVEKRNGFVSFLYALVVSFGTAVAIDWYSANQIEGVNISLIAAIIALIIVVYVFIRNGKQHIGASLKIALVVAGALVIIVILDWFSKNVQDLGQPPFFMLLFVLIPINFTLCRNRNNFVSFIMLAIGIFGWLVFFGIISGGNKTLMAFRSWIQEFKDY